MKRREVQPSDWPGFFHGFSQRHEGWLITMAILGRDGHMGMEARRMPLEGIAAEEIDGQRVVSVMVGDRTAGHLTRVVRNPKSVALIETDEGADEAVVIEAEDGTKTVVKFRSALPTEAVDDIMSEERRVSAES